MITFLQIAIILLLMALVGMLVGYLFGKLSCKRVSKDTMIQKGAYCEGEYAQEHHLNEQTDNLELEQLKDSADWYSEDKSSAKEPNNSASALMSSSGDSENEKLGSINDDNGDEKSELVANNEVKSENQSQVEDSEELNSNSEESEKNSNDNTSKNDSNSGEEKSELAVNDETKSESQEQVEDKEESEANNDASNEVPVENKQSNGDNLNDSDKKEQSTNEDSAQEDSENLVEKEIENTDSTIDTQKEDSKESEQNGYAPQFLSEPKDGKADNLCEIKGIGKVIDQKLKGLGVFHFEQIAQWTQKDISWVDEHLAFKGRVEREDWIGQAKLLAKGEETEFSQRVQRGEVESSKKD